MSDTDDLCFLCDQPGADKIPHPVNWPGERAVPPGRFVHQHCEQAETDRAFHALDEQARNNFLNRMIADHVNNLPYR